MGGEDHDRATHLGRYSEHNSRLQTWIGGYGAGLATALIYQFRTVLDDARQALKAVSPLDPAHDAAVLQIATTKMYLRHSLELIALALSLQIALLMLNKGSQWRLAHMGNDRQSWNWRCRLAHWFSGKYIFDIVCDIGSVGLLAIATYKAMQALSIFVP